MAWLGFILWIMIYWCIFTMLVTGRLSWIVVGIWCLPALGISIFYEPGMSVNGLSLLLCFFMFFLCRRSLVDVRMWNVHRRRCHQIFFGILYFICCIFFYYCIWQGQKNGFLRQMQQTMTNQWRMVWYILLGIPILCISFPMAEMVYNSFDRIWCKKEELVLLSCKFFRSGRHGGERGLWKGYYLDGIHNGTTYHFKLTKRTYDMLKKETKLRLQVRIGFLKGLYVIENPCPENVKKTRKKDRRNFLFGVLFFLIHSAIGIWYFWIYK